jgi:hypothetical protein
LEKFFAHLAKAYWLSHLRHWTLSNLQPSQLPKTLAPVQNPEKASLPKNCAKRKK